MRSLHPLSLYIAGGLLLGALGNAAGAEPGLREVLDRAWERATQVRVAESRGAEADASRAVADSWFPEPPSIGLSEKSDRFNGKRGEREREIELALPLWLPGQRDARQVFAVTDAADAKAALAAARLGVAGELRTAIWSLATIRAEREIAAERLATAGRLESDVARREKAGDLARTDLLLAREETLSAQSALAEARTRERQALERYRFLTGLEQLPARITEEVAGKVTAPHPRLRLAQSAAERARAELGIAREDRRNPPELSLGVQQARPDFASANVNTLRIAIRIPFASEGRNAPKIAAANSGLIRAEAELRQVSLELEAELREAEAALENTRLALEAVQTRAALAGEREKLQHRAFTLGELAMAEFMRVRAAANEARLELLRATHAEAAARARINQARGLLP